MGDRAIVVRLNVKEQVGIQVAKMYNVTQVPTFIVFDELGQERWRQSGQWPNEGRILTELLGEVSD